MQESSVNKKKKVCRRCGGHNSLSVFLIYLPFLFWFHSVHFALKGCLSFLEDE